MRTLVSCKILQVVGGERKEPKVVSELFKLQFVKKKAVEICSLVHNYMCILHLGKRFLGLLIYPLAKFWALRI